ncbi:hypothetical protein OUZ56_033652 [Daphnia magna]|uniref:Uncharacterized protein n=1 Tax=Daphnia magna TaxID=35525 RepID=A0ABQ9ZYQ4_9CRUS|nr:hypothetical protein OUZ56_033652 [Daphnia magna]
MPSRWRIEGEISRHNENLSVELGSDNPNQSDIDLLDSNEIKELKKDNQWNEVLNMQVASQENKAIAELLIGDETRELLSYNQLLKQARAITQFEKTADRVENSRDVSTDFHNPELIHEESQDRYFLLKAEIHTQVEQMPLDDPKSTPSTTTSNCPRVNPSQSSGNTQSSQLQLTFTPCNYLPYQQLQSRKVSFTPASIVDKSKKVKPLEETNQDLKIYVKELSRLMEYRMDYEDASKVADCIVQHVLTNTKRCINPSPQTMHNGQPALATSSKFSFLTSTPLHTQPLALSGQEVDGVMDTTRQGGVLRFKASNSRVSVPS